MNADDFRRAVGNAVGGAIGTPLGGFLTGGAVQPSEFDRQRMEMEQAMRQMQAQQAQDPMYAIRREIEKLQDDMREFDEFLIYAAKVDPNVERLLAGFKAKKRMGIK
jgi:hypothetical protein